MDYLTKIQFASSTLILLERQLVVVRMMHGSIEHHHVCDATDDVSSTEFFGKVAVFSSGMPNGDPLILLKTSQVVPLDAMWVIHVEIKE